MEAVTTGNDVGRQFVSSAVVLIANRRPVAIDVLNRNNRRFINDIVIFPSERPEQIARDFLLTVNRNATADQLFEIEHVMPVPVADADAPMVHVLFLQPVADTGLDQHIDGALLQNAGANSLLHVFAASRLEDDALDAAETKDPSQQGSRGAGPNDCYGNVHNGTSLPGRRP